MTFGHDAPLAIALIGLLMGMRHATDPDHVIAVLTIVSRERRLLSASHIGAIWGLGHAVTVLLVGAMIIVGKIAIPVRIGLAMEFAVAIVLILLGLEATARIVGRAAARLLGKSDWVEQPPLIVHSHKHAHGPFKHRHPHVHSLGRLEHAADDSHIREVPMRTASRFSIAYPRLRAFAVGLVHGLAGSAAIALLVLSAIPEPRWATLYLGIFCVGVVIGMALITTAVSAPITIATGRLAWMHQCFVNGSGLISFSFGLLLAYQIVGVDRLFGASPLLIPH
jgi:hypothetical protein